MKSFRNILLSFFTLTGSVLAAFYWPPSTTNHFEVIGGDELGFLLPLPDFTLVEDISDGFQRFIHDEHPTRELFLIVDGLHSASESLLNVNQYAEMFTQSWQDEELTLEVVYERVVPSGIGGKVKVLRKLWKYSSGTIHQLYFTNRLYGICLTAYCAPPKGTSKTRIKQEVEYWECLLDNLEPAIEFLKS